ncbi:type II secretion system F family protein [uncultured Roseobacter sp.]|uniref:type II secretion system F family protein n=1 Tax=uncultured Roseobacter sp. TaxID=114847 RepID=UPI00263334D0|nr:type II secretion system F family protein [uncultured Roseobacter sp.]
MPRFQYIAATNSGETQRGKLEAADIQTATSVLRSRNLIPLDVKQTELAALPSIVIRKSVSPGELAILTRQLATLFESGVRIDDALTAIARQSGARVAGMIDGLKTDIVEGQSLAAALSKHPKIFDAFYVSSVRAGEAAGKLGAVMGHLADHVESRSRNKNSIQLALIYPAILAVVSLAVVIALLVFVVPDIVRVFTSRGADLPGLTLVLIALSDGILIWWPHLIAGLLAAAFAIWRALQVPRLHMTWHRISLRTRLVRQIAATQFAGTLATLTQSGVSLDDALAAASGTVSNLAYRATLTEVSNAVRDGAALSQALSSHGIFSPMMITMVASGEAGGSLPLSLARYAQDTALSLNAIVKALVGLVEPLVLLVMGGIVMLLVLAILLPIVNLNNLVV